MTKLELDPWQKEVLDCEGNIALRSGRQVGKSTIISIKAAEFALKNPNKIILIISSVERQAQLLFQKTLGYLIDNYKKDIATGKTRPTMHILTLKNGSRIYSLPTGISGSGIRGYTVDMLIADEAAFIPDAVWQAVTPMLAVTQGKIILLSTPFGKGGYFYERFNDPSFKTFHISSEDCPRANKEFLAREKERMTKAQYTQEYLGEFVDELRQFFPSNLIEKVMVISRNPIGDSIAPNFPAGDNFLGVDVARLGEDETVLLSVVRINREKIKMIDMEITQKTRLTDTVDLIKSKDKHFKYRRMFIDSAGVGGGVFDFLLRDEQTTRRIIAIDNAQKSLDRDETRKKKLIKEDIYSNLLMLMEKGKIELFDDPEIAMSLRSVQYEYTDSGLKIFGNYTHIAEALVRAAWCYADKSLNIWVR